MRKRFKKQRKGIENLNQHPLSIKAKKAQNQYRFYAFFTFYFQKTNQKSWNFQTFVLFLQKNNNLWLKLLNQKK